MNMIVGPIALAKAVKKHASTHMKSHYKDEIDKYDVAMGTLFQKLGALSSIAQFESKPDLAKLFELHLQDILDDENQKAIKSNIRKNVYTADTLVDEVVSVFVDLAEQLEVTDFSREADRFAAIRKSLLKRFIGGDIDSGMLPEATEQRSCPIDVDSLLDNVNHSKSLQGYYRLLDSSTRDGHRIELVYSSFDYDIASAPMSIRLESSRLNFDGPSVLQELLDIYDRVKRIELDFTQDCSPVSAINDKLELTTQVLAEKAYTKHVCGIVAAPLVLGNSTLRDKYIKVQLNDLEDIERLITTNYRGEVIFDLVSFFGGKVVLSGTSFERVQRLQAMVSRLKDHNMSIGFVLPEALDKRLIVILSGMGVSTLYLSTELGTTLKSVIRYLTLDEMSEATKMFCSSEDYESAMNSFRKNRFLDFIVGN